MTNNIAQEATPQAVMEAGINQLEVGNGGANEAQRLDETEAHRVEVVSQTSLVHDKAHDEMGQEQGVQLTMHFWLAMLDQALFFVLLMYNSILHKVRSYFTSLGLTYGR